MTRKSISLGHVLMSCVLWGKLGPEPLSGGPSKRHRVTVLSVHLFGEPTCAAPSCIVSDSRDMVSCQCLLVISVQKSVVKKAHRYHDTGPWVSE